MQPVIKLRQTQYIILPVLSQYENMNLHLL